MANTTARLAELTGLDAESVQTQLVPFLSTFTNADALRVHLVDLLGSSQQARSFIDDYVHLRFPSKTKQQTKTTAEPSAASSAKTQQPKQKLSAKQKLLQPAKAKRVVNEATSAEAFGPVGTVYHKERDFVLDGYRTPPQVAAPASASGSASVAQDRAPAAATANATSSKTATATAEEKGRTAQPTVHSALPATDSGTESPAPDLEVIAPTAAMKELDVLLAELTIPDESQDVGPSELVVCFCQVTLPQAVSPIIPPTSLLRTQLITSLQDQRQALEVEERQRIERVRGERRARDEDARDRANAAASAFPALGGMPVASASGSHPIGNTYGMAGYGARSNAVTLALGRRQPTEAERSALQQRTHRVLRIPAKGGPQAKKGPKKSKKAKPEAGGGKAAAKTNTSSTATTAPTTAADEQEEDDSDDADALGESAVEVTVTILVPDPEDDGWSAHEPAAAAGALSASSDAHAAAIERQRAIALTVGGHRPLANPRLDPALRPKYTSVKEREERRAAWEALAVDDVAAGADDDATEAS
ncbi:hypothetical protein OC842_005203 [Tilletia horrida]|uniref:Uncharacterized protein n=1 Tax=Tilletia horrida TaxID=155126 RepID=A0AAN6G7T3_9BASI|nr:hypothetical protein OC842_005203 [Tilletia horrida]